MDKRLEIFLVVVVAAIIIWAIYQIIGVLQVLIPLVIVLAIALGILIYLSKKRHSADSKNLRGHTKKEKMIIFLDS